MRAKCTMQFDEYQPHPARSNPGNLIQSAASVAGVASSSRRGGRAPIRLGHGGLTPWIRYCPTLASTMLFGEGRENLERCLSAGGEATWSWEPFLSLQALSSPDGFSCCAGAAAMRDSG